MWIHPVELLSHVEEVLLRVRCIELIELTGAMELELGDGYGNAGFKHVADAPSVILVREVTLLQYRLQKQALI